MSPWHLLPFRRADYITVISADLKERVIRSGAKCPIETVPNGVSLKNFKIAYISSIKHPVLHKLISFGLIPGTTIKVHQKSPSFVIQLDNSQLALEKDIASHIFIWR